jgi:hypothetical protein
LLLRGESLLASDATVEVRLGNPAIQPDQVEPGIGFYGHKFVGDAIRPSIGDD